MLHKRIVAVFPFLLFAVACSEKKPDNGQLDQLKQLAEKMGASANSSGGARKEGDPCSLLDPKEVEAAIGPLAAPPYRGNFRPEPRADACRYDTQDHRRMLVTVTWSGGPMAMKMVHTFRGLTDAVSKQGETKVGVTVMSTGDTLSGDWDEIAQGPMQCCDLHALRGDQLVELDWTGTRLNPQGAGALLNTAIKRLDHPLAIDGTAGIPAAQKLFDADAKDSSVVMCDLVPQAVAESALGAKLLNPPTRGSAPGASGGRSCEYTAASPISPNMRRVIDLTLDDWRDGAAQFTTDQYTIGGASQFFKRMLPHDSSAKGTDSAASANDTTEHPRGPWDMIGYPASPGYEAVKGPLLFKVGEMGERQAALTLLARAVTALSTKQ